MNKNRKKNRETESTAEAKLKGFLDMIAPSVLYGSLYLWKYLPECLGTP